MIWLSGDNVALGQPDHFLEINIRSKTKGKKAHNAKVKHEIDGIFTAWEQSG